MIRCFIAWRNRHTADRLISLFTAENAEMVRAVNEAALIPFGGIEAAVELRGPG